MAARSAEYPSFPRIAELTDTDPIGVGLPPYAQVERLPGRPGQPTVVGPPIIATDPPLADTSLSAGSTDGSRLIIPIVITALCGKAACPIRRESGQGRPASMAARSRRGISCARALHHAVP